MDSRHDKLIPTPTKALPAHQCSSATLSLKRTLQKHIRSLVNALPSIEDAEKEGEKHILALSNFLEQRECVSRVDDISIEMMRNFPDLKSRLMLKISTDMEKEIEFLTNLLAPLRGLKQALYQARADILSLASLPTAQDLDHVTMYEGTPTVPALVTMMDSMEAVEKETRELYCSRLHYLENVSDHKMITSDTLYDLWMADASKVSTTIKDCREITRYFLEVNLS